MGSLESRIVTQRFSQALRPPIPTYRQYHSAIALRGYFWPNRVHQDVEVINRVDEGKLHLLWKGLPMNSTALIAPVHLARPNQACPGVGLRWGVCQMCRREMQHELNSSLEARIQERARIARELHHTLLQSFQGLLLRFQAVANLLPARPQDAKHKLE